MQLEMLMEGKLWNIEDGCWTEFTVEVNKLGVYRVKVRDQEELMSQHQVMQWLERQAVRI